MTSVVFLFVLKCSVGLKRKFSIGAAERHRLSISNTQKLPTSFNVTKQVTCRSPSLYNHVLEVRKWNLFALDLKTRQLYPAKKGINRRFKHRFTKGKGVPHTSIIATLTQDLSLSKDHLEPIKQTKHNARSEPFT